MRYNCAIIITVNNDIGILLHVDQHLVDPVSRFSSVIFLYHTTGSFVLYFHLCKAKESVSSSKSKRIGLS